MKKIGGIIKNWQIHILSDKPEFVARMAQQYDEFEMDNLMVFTGTVVEDPLERWQPGFHMRSSIIFKHDKKTGEIETMNTIYTVLGEGGNDVFDDMGAAVMKIFY